MYIIALDRNANELMGIIQVHNIHHLKSTKTNSLRCTLNQLHGQQKIHRITYKIDNHKNNAHHTNWLLFFYYYFVCMQSKFFNGNEDRLGKDPHYFTFTFIFIFLYKEKICEIKNEFTVSTQNLFVQSRNIQV